MCVWLAQYEVQVRGYEVKYELYHTAVECLRMEPSGTRYVPHVFVCGGPDEISRMLATLTFPSILHHSGFRVCVLCVGVCFVCCHPICYGRQCTYTLRSERVGRESRGVVHAGETSK